MKEIALVFLCVYGHLTLYPSFAISGNKSGRLRGCDVAKDCWHQSSVTSSSSGVKYLYNSTVNGCVQVDSRCLSDNVTVFSDLLTCRAVCVADFDASTTDCQKSRHGCCPDGTTPRGPAGVCTEEEQSSSNTSGSFTHWQLLVAGVCSVVLGVGIVSLVFAVTYVDRMRKRDKQRRYISQVLKMYEDNIDSTSGDSDSSCDNPETKNLFERL